MGDYFSFFAKSYSSSETVATILAIAIFSIYAKLIKPQLVELKEYKSEYKNKIDELATKEDLETFFRQIENISGTLKSLNDIITILTDNKNAHSDDISTLKLVLTNDIEKLNVILTDIKTTNIDNLEITEKVQNTINDIKKSINILNLVINRSITQLEQKGYIEKIQDDKTEITEIKTTVNELATLVTVLADTIEKSKPTKKLDRV